MPVTNTVTTLPACQMIYTILTQGLFLLGMASSPSTEEGSTFQLWRVNPVMFYYTRNLKFALPQGTHGRCSTFLKTTKETVVKESSHNLQTLKIQYVIKSSQCDIKPGAEKPASYSVRFFLQVPNSVETDYKQHPVKTSTRCTTSWHTVLKMRHFFK